MTLVGGLLGLIFLLVIVAVIYIFYMQRQFVDMDEKCKNALSSIKVQLNSRWDALLALAKTASAYAKHESETIIQTIQQRRQVGGSNPTVKDIRNQQAGLADVMNRLMVISEAYPELKASELFLNTQNSVKQYEENVRVSRMVYNDTVTIFNRNVSGDRRGEEAEYARTVLIRNRPRHEAFSLFNRYIVAGCALNARPAAVCMHLCAPFER